MSDDTLSRRALVGGLAVGTAGIGVVYGAGKIGDDGGDEGADVDVRTSDRTVTLVEADDGPLTVDHSGKPVVGAAAADVTAYYWTDFQCPFCERFERETFPDLYADYVESGTLEFVVLQFPYIGEDSQTAARLSNCVWRRVSETDPDRYWDWHARVFDGQGDERSGWASPENLLSLTGDVEGVDRDAVATCLEQRTDAVDEAIDADRTLGEGLDIGGTPGFILRNTDSGAMGRITGAQPYDRFSSTVEKIREA